LIGSLNQHNSISMYVGAEQGTSRSIIILFIGTV